MRQVRPWRLINTFTACSAQQITTKRSQHHTYGLHNLAWDKFLWDITGQHSVQGFVTVVFNNKRALSSGWVGCKHHNYLHHNSILNGRNIMLFLKVYCLFSILSFFHFYRFIFHFNGMKRPCEEDKVHWVQLSRCESCLICNVAEYSEGNYPELFPCLNSSDLNRKCKRPDRKWVDLSRQQKRPYVNLKANLTTLLES